MAFFFFWGVKIILLIMKIVIIIALWVRLNVKWEIGKFLPHPSFYPCTNISDRIFNLAAHFIRIQIFQIDFEETK